MSALRLPPLPTTRDLVRLYKLSAMKQLSQNFLMDQRLCDKIINKAGSMANCHVLEVGPGPSCLTRSILRKNPEKLIVVEKDQRFKPVLDMLSEALITTNTKMDIIYDDITRLPLDGLFPERLKKSWEDNCPDIHVIGNLPFNVSTHLIIDWLHAISERRGPWALGRTRMTLTFQKEVAERLVSEAIEIQRSRLSVMAQAWTKPVLRFIIPGRAFVPKPDVDVGVVTFVPLVTPRTNHGFKYFEKITRQMFSFRQKYSIRCAETLFPLDCRKEMALVMYQLADLNPETKVTELTVEDIDRVASAYQYLLEKNPHLVGYEYRASQRILPLKSTTNITLEDYAEP